MKNQIKSMFTKLKCIGLKTSFINASAYFIMFIQLYCVLKGNNALLLTGYVY
jgi:hypothetical protein